MILSHILIFRYFIDVTIIKSKEKKDNDYRARELFLFPAFLLLFFIMFSENTFAFCNIAFLNSFTS